MTLVAKARIMIYLSLAVVLCSLLAQAGGKHATRAAALKKPVPNPCDDELAVARILEDAGDWKGAETHFESAVKEPQCRFEAAIGVQTARGHQEEDLLRTGRIYESEHQWTKAEEIYRVAAGDAAVEEVTRYIAGERLKSVLQEEEQEKKLPEWRDSIAEWVKGAAETVAFVLGVVLLYSAFKSIKKSRRTILIYPFSAPNDELKNGINIHLRYARELMQNPALSPTAPVPPVLLENLLLFSDEVEAIEDLEIAGSKIPFAALGRRFGEPRIQVRGGFDGVAPVGSAYSVIKLRQGNNAVLIQHAIRVGVPSQQRVDLLDFAYDVIRKASSAYELL